MARKRTEIIDDEGNELPPPEPGTPVANLIYLLEWGRKRGFRIGPTVKMGELVAQVRDLRQEAAVAQIAKDGAPELEPESDMAIVLGAEG